MREIKFRAWDGESMKDNSSLTGSYINPIAYKTWNGRPLTFLQYTGLKDAKGQDIYEGDVLRWHDGEYGYQYYAVEWDEYGWFADGQALADINHLCEIIGNIYENKDLLK